MTEDVMMRLHTFVEGHVQGVGFRMFVVDEAQRLNLTGWVRNTWQGEVEVLAEGPRASLEKLLDALRRGPQGAYVVNTRADWETASKEFNFFEVRQTY